jgi:hypothetical protein
MGTPNLADEVMIMNAALNGVMASTVGDVVAITSVGLAVNVSAGLTLSRKPTASALTLGASAFTIDAPGRYDIAVTNAGVVRTVSIFAFPAAVLTLSVGQGRTVTRTHLLALVNAWNGSQSAAATTALETVPVVYPALLPTGVAWSHLAN